MNSTSKKIRLSVDDGCASDLRVAELGDKYKIECVFYWPVEWHSLAYENGYEPLTWAEAKHIAKQFEIGSHTITHQHLTKIDEPWVVWDEILGSRVLLERMFKKPIRKFCPPRGYTNEHLTDLTLANYDSQRLTKGPGLVHIHPNSGANNNKPWRECVDENTTELWCHSWELDKYDLWKELEDFLASA